MFTNWNLRIWEYDFLSPAWLWGLILVPFCVFLMIRNEKNKNGELKFARSEEDQRGLSADWISQLRGVIIVLYGVIAVLLIVAMAKPYDWASDENSEEEYKNGIDIILAMDVSMSMYARDFVPNRMEASKRVAKEFIDGRRGDRIGLVLYAGEAYTASPATLDYDVLKERIDEITGENMEPGTAIGTGLGTAVARFKDDSLSTSAKVIILLTDGSNNSGQVTPDMAAEIAKAKNIRVYTIGVCSYGEALSPVPTPFGIRYENVKVDIDENTLINIANKTNGKYFRAANEDGLKTIYSEIEKLEKTKMLDKKYKSEMPATPSAFLNWAFLMAIITWSLKTILFKTNE